MSSKNSKDFLKKPSEEATLQNIYNTKKALEKLSNHRIKTYQSFKTNSLAIGYPVSYTFVEFPVVNGSVMV